MKKIANIVCILVTASALNACAYFETDEEPVDVSTQQPTDAINLTAGQQPLMLNPVEYEDVAKVIHESSDGSIQIFPLEDGEFAVEEPGANSSTATYSDGSVEVQPVSSMPLYQESTMERYPGVEIFPLDDKMAALVGPNVMTYSTPVTPSALTPFPVAEESKTRASDSVSFAIPGGAPVTVYFDHDSVALRQEDLMVISDAARAYNGRDITVAGHASVQSSIQDPIQRKIINLKISMDRAFSVARALIESGVPAERIETKAYGETQPALASDRPVDVAGRRVEIYGVSVQ